MGKDYKTKLFISVEDENGLQLLSPIRDINPALNTPNAPIHSLEADNVGVFKANDTYTFSLTVDAVRDDIGGTNPAKVLTALQVKHREFKIVMVERQTQASQGNKNWAFDEILMEGCYVNNSAPSRAVVAGQPVATFNCMALGINIDGEYFNGTLPI